MKILYVAQFHETCGYTHAAHGYLESIDKVIEENPNFEIKILSVSLDPRKIHLNYHKGKTSQSKLDLLDKYHFSSQEEFELFVKDDYQCVWHMTSVLPAICKNKNVGVFYNNISANLNEIILGSKKNYHILAWETDKLCEEYESCIRKYSPEIIFAPSLWNKDVFSLVSKSVFLPHLIEKQNAEYATSKVNLPFNVDDNFCILSMSEWTKRKNFECLIRSFMLEFHNRSDAYLVIKTSLPAGMDKKSFLKEFEYIKKTTRVSGKPNIVVILDYLSDEKINYLYSISNLFAITSYGEGFSLPTAQAVSLGVPVLCPDQGGHVDYLDKNNRYFVSGVWDTVFDAPPYDPDSNWYIPTIKNVREKMTLAYQDWQQKNQQALQSAKLNSAAASQPEFFKESIGNKFFKTIESQSKNTQKSTKIANLKRKLKNKTIEEKMEILKDSFKGEECFILNCGPSLNDYDREKLKELLNDKLTLSVKQAYNIFKEETDFHFFNCSNLPKLKNAHSPHYEYDKNTISIASSNYEEYSRWVTMQDSDVFFKIPIRTEINNEFLVRTGNIDKFLIKNNLTRPCGPGIMYETVLFMAIHLGVSSITCIGWDLTDNKVNPSNYQHFYGSSEGLLNRGDILEWEIEETKQFSKDFYEWFSSNNIELKIASDKSSLYKEIPRVKLEL